MHWNRLRKTGVVGGAEKLVGKGSIIPSGYRMLYRPSHPNASKYGNVMEHVVVMTEKLGRPLSKGENVHHLNGDRLDNRPENLELWVTMQPTGQRVTDRVRAAIELLARYSADESLWPDDVSQFRELFNSQRRLSNGIQPLDPATG